MSDAGLHVDQLSGDLGCAGALVVAPAAEPDLPVSRPARIRALGDPESMRPSVVLRLI